MNTESTESTEDRWSWWDRINAAEKRGEFDAADREDSRDWATCGVGVQDSRLPRDAKSGRPLNDEIYMRGQTFWAAVTHNKFNEARVALGMIEMLVAAELKGMVDAPR